MLSTQAERHAHDLRILLGDGTLTRIGDADVGDGMTLPLDLAATIALSDLDDLTDLVADGIPVDEGRWRQLEADLEHLYRLATPA
jgi:hypothetical protein